MKRETFETYIRNGWSLFRLVPTKGGAKGAKGRYSTPKGWNDLSKPQPPYNADWIYGGIPPKDMMVLDVDIKGGKEGDTSFQKFLKDFAIELKANVSTPSGGYHVYVKIPSLPDGVKNFKKRQERYPDIDFIGHGTEFVMLGEQEVEGYGVYQLFDIGAQSITNDLQLFEQCLDYRLERKEGSTYEDIDRDMHFMSRPSAEEIKSYLDRISPDLGYDEGWRDVIMALNQWDLGGEEGLALAKEWSQKALLYCPSDDEIETNYHQNEASSPDFWHKLISIANRQDVLRIETAMIEAKTTDELVEIAASVGRTPIKNEDRERLAEKWRERFNEVDNPSGMRRPHKSTVLNKLMRYTPASEQVDEATLPKVVMVGSTFRIIHGEVLSDEFTISTVKKALGNIGCKENEIETIMTNVKQVHVLRQTPDYLIKEKLKFEFEEIGNTKFYRLFVKKNPLYNWRAAASDEEIENDFFNRVWGGKVDDIVRIIALSIKTNERKLNRLMLVAPSNTGKSELFSHMGFQKITMKRLVHAMNADKGVGSQVIEGIRETGFLLIDEANTQLTAEIKDMDKELHIDQFGKGGTQVIPLLFTALTSTHKTATRNSSDELYNRFLQVEMTNSEYTLSDSHLFHENRDRYTEVVKSRMITLFLETLHGEEGKEELAQLQEKYRLPVNNDLDEFLYEVSEKVIEMAKSNMNSDVFMEKAGTTYVRSKTALRDTIEDLLKELPSIDHGKYSDLLMGHFIEGERVSIKINGKPVKFYRMNIGTYTKDENQKVVDMFDDLDIENL